MSQKGKGFRPPPPIVNGGVVLDGQAQAAAAARQQAARAQQEFDAAVNNTADDPAEPGELGWEPVGDRVAVRRHEVTRTESGLELAGGAADSIRTPTGTVLAVGPECKQVKVGDTVSCDPTVPCFPLMRPSGKVFVFKEGQILGIERRSPNRTAATTGQ